MKQGTIVISPPWARSGSANIVAAQTAAHSKRRSEVFLLLAPVEARYSKKFWRRTLKDMKFTGVKTVSYPRSRSISWLVWWRRAKGDDAISIVSHHAAANQLPAELINFIQKKLIEVIHVNHVFSIRLALKVAALIESFGKNRPAIILDTHDIQTEVFVAGKRVNRNSGKPDSYKILLEAELFLVAKADILVHCSQGDFNFFKKKLPLKKHRLILPTLNPENEVALKKQRKRSHKFDIDFMYAGNNHEANLKTVQWFLNKVKPLVNKNINIRIIGTIKNLVQYNDSKLFSRYREIFVGEVPSLLKFYRRTRAILAPAVAGTGTSIKLIEALCAGKIVVTTTIGLRGLPKNTGSKDIYECNEPKEVAKAINAIVKSSKSISLSNAKLYDTFFSNKVYAKAIDAVITAAVNIHAQKKPNASKSAITEMGSKLPLILRHEFPKNYFG